MDDDPSLNATDQATVSETSSSIPSEAPGVLFISRVLNWWQNLSPDKQTRIVRSSGVLIAVFYLLSMWFIAYLRPDHAFVAFLIIAVFFGDARDFIKHWFPFIFLWITYDMLRGIAYQIGPYVHVRDLYEMERTLTGWFLNGNIPPFWFQEYKLSHPNSPIVATLDIVAALFYFNHFTMPLLLGWLLYWKQEDRTEYWRYVATLLATSYAAFLTFVLYPAAPPWYVWNNGGELRFSPPPRGDVEISAAGLLNFDQMTGFSFSQSVYQLFNANPYAAVPSLHAGYSLIIAIFFIRKYGKKGTIAILYPLGMWFSAMWLNHHYLIDLLWGAAYVVVIYSIVLRLIKPKSSSSQKEEILNSSS